jgi:membrane protein implicated in regulation of membrane protease activity
LGRLSSRSKTSPKEVAVVRDVYNWILIIGGALLVLLEVILGAATGFDFLLIGSAMVLGGVLGLVTGSAMLGAATAGVLALLYVFLGRRRIRRRLMRKSVESNTDALLGRTARVVGAITDARAGRIRVDGEEWRAEAAGPIRGPIEEGRTVRVVRIDGVTVFVEPAEGSTGGSVA